VLCSFLVLKFRFFSIGQARFGISAARTDSFGWESRIGLFELGLFTPVTKDPRSDQKVFQLRILSF
jgi:hypothetical protein